MGLFDRTTPRDLLTIAREHSKSRVLSDTTRAYFGALADGMTPNEAAQAQELSRDDVALIYFETAASASTRAGQSMGRRYMLGDINRLREHALHLPDVPLPEPTRRVMVAIWANVPAQVSSAQLANEIRANVNAYDVVEVQVR